MDKPYTVEQLATALVVHFRINVRRPSLSRAKVARLARRLINNGSISGTEFVAIITSTVNVRFWHKADIRRLSSNVRFWG